MIDARQLEILVQVVFTEIRPKKIILFGSFAKGTYKEDSDLDILVIIEHSDEPRFKRARKIRKALWGEEDNRSD